MFYRLAKFFFKKDGSLAPRAVAIVSIVQGLIIADIGALVFRSIYSLSETAQYSKQAGQVGVVIVTVIISLNYRRYRRGYSKFSDRWRNAETPSQKRFRGYLVVLGIILPFALMLFLGTSAYRQ